MHKILTNKDSNYHTYIFSKPMFLWNSTVQSDIMDEINNMHPHVRCLNQVIFREHKSIERILTLSNKVQFIIFCNPFKWGDFKSLFEKNKFYILFLKSVRCLKNILKLLFIQVLGLGNITWTLHKTHKK